MSLDERIKYLAGERVVSLFETELGRMVNDLNARVDALSAKADALADQVAQLQAVSRTTRTPRKNGDL